MGTDRFVFKKKDFIYICIALLLFFQIYLQNIFGVFQYLDEIVTVYCLGVIVLKGLRGGLEKKNFSLLMIILLITVVGVASNITAGVQTGWKPILSDIGNTFKVFIVYLGAKTMLTEKNDKEKIIGTLAFFVKIFVWIAFAFMILHELHIVSMGNDVRYGLRSFQFVNHGAGQLSLMFYFIMTILMLDMKNKFRGGQDKLSISMIVALILWISTLRSRAFMYSTILVLLYWKVVKKQEKFRLSIGNIFATLIVLCFFAADQFETYFSNTATARSNFLRYGIYTMQRYFPLGSGFATYGTDSAVKYYTKLYVEYGFKYVYGLNPSNPMFAHDTYWPAIMAQFGVVGLIAMIILIWKLCMDMMRRTNGDRYSHWIILFVCITQVTSSIATATFFHFVTVSLFFIIPLAFSNEEEEKNNENTYFENNS